MFSNLHYIRGVSMIEALIAAVVLSVGLIAVAKLQSDLVSNAGTNKARSEAIALIEGDMERLRNFVLETQYDAVGSWDSSGDRCTDLDALPGTNATFERTWCIDRFTSPERRRLTITYQWKGPRDPADDNTRWQTVALTSTIAWDDPMMSASLAQQSGDPSVGVDPDRAPKSPGGIGFERTDDRPVDDTGQEILLEDEDPGTYTEDGTRTENPGTAFYIVDNDGNVWKARKDDASISSISGTIFVDNKVSPDIDPNEIQLLSSGGDQLPCLVQTDRTNLTTIPTGTSGNQIVYRALDYVCFKTEEWYGNIAVVYTGNNAPRVCVGDALIVAYDEFSGSRHPWPSTGRNYRGFGVIEDRPAELETVGIKSSKTFTSQNFLVTRFGINERDGEQDLVDKCHDAMTRVDSNDWPPDVPSLYGSDANPNPPEDLTPTSWAHAGSFVCLSENFGYCPTTLPTGEPPTTVISGEVDRGGVDVRGILSSLEVIEGDSLATLTVCDAVSFIGDTGQYSCTINWRGSSVTAGAPVNVTLTVVLEDGHELCGLPVGDGFRLDAASIGFVAGTDKPALTQDFSIRNSPCP